MCHGSDAALQGTAHVLTGMVQSQEQYVALLLHLLPVRLHWNSDYAELVLLSHGKLELGCQSVTEEVFSLSSLVGHWFVCPCRESL